MLSQMLRLPLKPGQYRSVADTEKLNQSYTPLRPSQFSFIDSRNLCRLTHRHLAAGCSALKMCLFLILPVCVCKRRSPCLSAATRQALNWPPCAQPSRSWSSVSTCLFFLCPNRHSSRWQLFLLLMCFQFLLAGFSKSIQFP